MDHFATVGPSQLFFFDTLPDYHFVIADKQLFALHPFPGDPLLFDANEQTKSLDTVCRLVEQLLARGIKRKDPLLVVGGGVTLDVGGLVASLLHRGVPLHFVPTTFLAQVDSALGGKNGVNVHGWKNQVGTFYPPEKIFYSPHFLDTLLPDEWRSGLAECLKMAYLIDKKEWEEALADTHWLSLLKRAIACKKLYVEKDPFDRGIRRHLNFGHTFGHAFESASKGTVPHGIAVALGMAVAFLISAEYGLLPWADAHQLVQSIAFLFTPYHQKEALWEENAFFEAILHDKKGCFLLTRGPGQCVELQIPIETLKPLIEKAKKDIMRIVAA